MAENKLKGGNMKKGKTKSREGAGSDPFRISIYIYPNQMEWIEKMAQERRISKRSLFFEIIHMAIQDFKAGWHLS